MRVYSSYQPIIMFLKLQSFCGCVVVSYCDFVLNFLDELEHIFNVLLAFLFGEILTSFAHLFIGLLVFLLLS